MISLDFPRGHWMRYLNPFSYISPEHWDNVEIRDTCRNTAFLIFVQLSLIVISSTHSSKRQIINFSLLRVITMHFSPWIVPTHWVRRSRICQGISSRCCHPPTLICVKGLHDCEVWETSVHRCTSFSPILTLVPFSLASAPSMITQRSEKHLASPGAKWNPENLWWCINLIRLENLCSHLHFKLPHGSHGEGVIGVTSPGWTGEGSAGLLNSQIPPG